jgi:hypothetical protein
MRSITKFSSRLPPEWAAFFEKKKTRESGSRRALRFASLVARELAQKCALLFAIHEHRITRATIVLKICEPSGQEDSCPQANLVQLVARREQPDDAGDRLEADQRDQEREQGSNPGTLHTTSHLKDELDVSYRILGVLSILRG